MKEEKNNYYKTKQHLCSAYILVIIVVSSMLYCMPIADDNFFEVLLRSNLFS